jgi:intracellular septation protein
MRNLLYAARPLLMDFLGTLVFVALIALKVDPAIAAILGASTTVGQVALQKFRKLPVAPLQWMSLGLILVSGVATVLTHDPRFVMIKATVVYAIVGTVMLQRGWMLRYVPPIARGHVDDVMTVFGYIWAGMMFLTGVANLVVALAFTAWWPAFVAVVPLASKITLFAIQYLITRAVGRRRILASREAAAGQTLEGELAAA